MPGGAKDSRPLADRLLAVLDAFDRAGTTELALGEIAARASLPLATAHRLVGRLVAWGGLERTPAGGYQLGRRIWRLGTRYPEARTLRQVALPFLEDLLALTRQNVQIAVLDGLAALYIERLTARDSVVVLADVGRRLPLHATGVGLVLLAFAPRRLLDEVLEAGPRRYLDATMTTEAQLRPRLERIVREGVATTRDEMTAGSASVAAPVRDASGGVVAAVSIIVPSDAPVDPRYELAVRLAAHGISRGLGWAP
ncbi:MAG: IclR family transcriptional regulator [Microbacteriaceae bacterium]|nr:IclR family transcriptional regulator [Microbacteriaceae bacterium]